MQNSQVKTLSGNIHDLENPSIFPTPCPARFPVSSLYALSSIIQDLNPSEPSSSTFESVEATLLSKRRLTQAA